MTDYERAISRWEGEGGGPRLTARTRPGKATERVGYATGFVPAVGADAAFAEKELAHYANDTQRPA